ncbi:hypothetical protein Ct61P_14200 [Colletotrichum tofieldiae]|nr:hypothetical protein Ct61P_14200 [Colletotrichum tofieldiae]
MGSAECVSVSLGGEGDEAKAERERMRGWAEEICEEDGIELEVVAGVPYRGAQETAQSVANFTRAICEVCPRVRGEGDGVEGGSGR